MHGLGMGIPSLEFTKQHPRVVDFMAFLARPVGGDLREHEIRWVDPLLQVSREPS